MDIDNDLLIEAKEYRINNISIMPIRSEGKDPGGLTVSWSHLRNKIISKEEFMDMHSKGGDGLAVICGYNDIEVIDVDSKYDLTGKLWDNLREAIFEHIPELLDSLIVKTVGGGYHIYYKCKTIEGNKKLAGRIATEVEQQIKKEKFKVLIETRGSGGYVCCPPTRGYKIISGSISNIIYITEEQREILFGICKSFNEIPKVENIVKDKDDNKLYAQENSPFRDFDKRGDAVAILNKYGWSTVRVSGDRIFLLRPGDTKSKTSANYHVGLNLFYVFSSSTEFEPSKAYGPASIYIQLECNGDTKEAYHRLLKEGYGEKFKGVTYDVNNIVEQFNKHYAVVDCNGSVEIWRINIDENGQKKESRYKLSDFNMMFSNKKISEENKKPVPITSVWLNSPSRRQYNSVVFKPGQKLDESIYNFWSGFYCDNIPGDCSKYLRHIREVIAENDEVIYEYILDWMADAVQNLQKRPGVALVIRGDQGVGKGVFVENFGKLFGRHYLHITDSNSIVNKFNSLLEGKCLVFADEAFWGKDKIISGKLKGLVTEKTMQIERKGSESYASDNYIRLIACSNNDIVVPVERGDRRFFVVEATSTYKGNYKYFEDIQDQMANGGLNALLDMLLKRDISSKSIKNYPKTSALTDQKASTLDDVEQFIVSLLEAGSFKALMENFPIYLKIDKLNLKEIWSDKVPTRDLFSIFRSWCDFEKVKYPTNSLSLFSKKIRKIFNIKYGVKADNKQAFSFYTHQECMERFNHYLGSEYFQLENDPAKELEDLINGKL